VRERIPHLGALASSRSRRIDVCNWPRGSLQNRLATGEPSIEVKRRVLRKFGLHSRLVVREQVVPVVTAEISGTVLNHAGLEDWLAKGVGPQKAFGFGAFLPC
jgi:hypothetical protein